MVVDQPEKRFDFVPLWAFGYDMLIPIPTYVSLLLKLRKMHVIQFGSYVLLLKRKT